jgi:uncharacterized FlaG/YvyC family protein
MDVKHSVRNLIPLANVSVSELKRRETVTGETKASSDRDGDGREFANGGGTPERGLSREEILEAIELLSKLPGVLENGLTVRLSENDGIPVVYIEDRTGKVVRRIPESELSQVKARASASKATGNLLNKAM